MEKYGKDYSVFNNIHYLIKRIIAYDKLLIFLIAVNCIIQTGSIYLTPLLSRGVAYYGYDNQNIQKLIICIVVIGIMYVLVNILQSYTSRSLWWRYIDLGYHFDNIKIKKILSISYSRLEEPKILDMLQKANNASKGTTNGVQGFVRTGSSLLVTVAQFILSTVLVSNINPVLIVFVIPMAYLSFVITDKTYTYQKKNITDVIVPWERKTSYYARISSDFSLAKDIRLYSMQEWLMKKLRFENNKIYNKNCERNRIWILEGVLTRLISMSQRGVLYLYLLHNVYNKGMLVSDFIFYVGTIELLYSSILNILEEIAELRHKSKETNDYRKFIDIKEETETDLTPEYDSDWEIVFDNVSFQYKGQSNYALKNINVKISKGDKVALIGLNGSGKTTFVKLICRLYDVTEGRILFNGVDINKYNLVDYYKLFAPAFQEIIIFALPIVQNISMKTMEQSDFYRASEKLKEIGLYEKIEGLKDGLKTQMLKILYDDGIDLSGGEKQKLTLARALYKDSAITILDEPTAAMDPLAEYNLYSRMDEISNDNTIIYVSHRLSSTRFCNHIYLFENGEIVESGTHVSLLQRQGKYAQLYELQAKYYK